MKTLAIQCPGKGGRIETVHCQNRLREVPGRREVYAARWGERAVIVKIFYARWKGRRHLAREWNGLCELRERHLPAPRPLFHGTTAEGHRVLVTEEITDSVSLLELFQRCGDAAAWDRLASAALGYLAAMHEAGVLQKDLHPGNFLYRNDELYALDPAQMRWYPNPLSREVSLRNLAVLFCSLPGWNDSSAEGFLQRYLARRGWQTGVTDGVLFEACLRQQRAGLLRSSLRKTMRDCTAFVALREPRRRGMFRRDAWEAPEARRLATDPEALIAQGEVLKQGNTCTVCRVRIGDRDAVIKRYNHKGWWHSLRHTIKRSRARRCWLYGYRLAYLRIPTALPLAFVEVKTGPLVRQSYLVNEYIEGKPIHERLADPRLSADQRDRLLAATHSLLKALCDARVSHHDLKTSNILIRGEEPVLIDLDSMKSHRLAAAAQRQCRKMTRQFEHKLEAMRTKSRPSH